MHEIATVDLSKIYFLKNAKKTCKPNNRELNRDWKTPFSSKMKPLYVINKKNNWHCQRQKTSKILLASDFVMWTKRYILGLVFCFGYTDYKFICYLLLFVICLFVAVIYLFARSPSTNCEISSNLVKTVLAFLSFLFTWSQLHFVFLYILLNTNW